MRVKEPGNDGAADESMLADASYDGAYSTGVPGPANSAANSGQQADGALSDKCLYTEPTATEAATCLDSDGGNGATGNADACTVDAIVGTGAGVTVATADGVICPVTTAASACTRAEIDAQEQHVLLLIRDILLWVLKILLMKLDITSKWYTVVMVHCMLTDTDF